jgi:hypothetical protein
VYRYDIRDSEKSKGVLGVGQTQDFKHSGKVPAKLSYILAGQKLTLTTSQFIKPGLTARIAH